MTAVNLAGSLSILADGSTLNVRVEKLAEDPPPEELTPEGEGRCWYNENLKVLSFWNGTAIIRIPQRYEFNSSTAGTTFLINHNLGQQWLHVTAIDLTTGLKLTNMTVEYIDNNSLTVTFGETVISCKIICSI